MSENIELSMSTLKNSITMNPLKYWDDMEFSENIWKSGVAEGVGFEPTVRVSAQRFSRPSRSTTPAPLPRWSNKVQASVGLKRRRDTSRKSRRAASLRCDLQQLSRINAGKTVDL